MVLESLEVISALVIGVMVIVVTTLIISVKTMTLLIHITRRRDLYICPGHNMGKRKQNIPEENDYDTPLENSTRRQYASYGTDDLHRNNSRTDEKQIIPSMNEPVYYDIAPAQEATNSNPAIQRNNVRRSQTTVV